MKKKVYFFESNVALDKTYYLPYVSGLLTAYARTFPILDESYSFEEFIFMRDRPENMAKIIIDPFIVAFSVCIWNHQLSLAVAEIIKRKYPQCHIVFGGPQVLRDDKERYPFIDHIVLQEGEKQFIPLLGELIGQKINIPTEYNIDDFPSPYVSGLYDDIINNNPQLNFQTIVETDRNCPFLCNFCFWGKTDSKKIKYHGFDYLLKEAQWIGKNRIKYVFFSSANFGMYERDQEIAKIYCDVKKEYGYPDKVRVCYGKNKTENVFKTAMIMHKGTIAKAVTLARQSNDLEVLKNINRSNIKLSVYDELRERYQKEGIATYTEIILGLPGETKESFKKGVDEIAGTPTQLFIYHCTILPNTEMYKPEYIAKHGIRTVRVPLTEIHGEIRKPEYVVEYEDIVIETNTMPMFDWIECAVYSWLTQLRCVFGVEDVPKDEIFGFTEIAYGITQGKSRGQIDERFGLIYWEPEEIAYLRICLERGEIDGDLKEFAKKNVLWGRKSKVQKLPTNQPA